jgi:hypothetical protein
MSRPSTRPKTNPNPGQIQIQADKEAAASNRKARAERRATGKHAECRAKVDRLSGMEHQIMQEDLDEQTPHRPKSKCQANPRTQRNPQDAKRALREAVNNRLDQLAAGSNAPSTEAKGRKRRTDPASEGQGIALVEDDHPEPKKGRYELEEAEAPEGEVPAQKSGERGRGGVASGRRGVGGGGPRGAAAVRVKKLANKVPTEDESDLTDIEHREPQTEDEQCSPSTGKRAQVNLVSAYTRDVA